MAIELNLRKVAFVAHVLAIVVTMMMLYWLISYRGGFAWESPNKSFVVNLHPFLMLIGLVILGGEAIISYKSLPFERATNRKIHSFLHLIAALLGFSGTFVQYKDSRSLHCWIGYIVLFLYALLVKYSFVFCWHEPSTNDDRRGFDRRDLIKIHGTVGLCTFGLAVGNSVLGFFKMQYSGAAMHESEALLVNLMSIITIIFASFVIFVVYIESPPPSVDDSYSAI